MISAAVARRYAKGLLGVALEKGEELQPLAQQLNDLAAAVDSSGPLEQLLMNPAIESTRKTATLTEILEVLEAGAMLKRFVEVLGQNERLDHLREAAGEFTIMVDDQTGVINAEVTSPTPLDAVAIADLEDKLARASGRAVRLDVKTDPELLGGLTTRIGDVVYDGSLRYQLEQMRQRITAS